MEKNLLHFMFYYSEAIKTYIEIEYFENVHYNKIANCIVDFNQENKEIKLADLITAIEFDFFNKKINEKTKKVFDNLILEEEKKDKLKGIYPKFSEKLLANYKFELIKERNSLIKKKTFNNKKSKLKTDEEKTILDAYNFDF